MNPKIYPSKCISCCCWSSMHEQQKRFTCWCYTINFSAFAGGKLGRLDASEVSISSTFPLFRFLFTGTVLNGSSSAVSLAIFSLELSAMLFSHVCRKCRNRTFRSQFSINPGQSDFVPPLSPPFSYLYLRVIGIPGYPSRITRSLSDLITKRFGYPPSF